MRQVTFKYVIQVFHFLLFMKLFPFSLLIFTKLGKAKQFSQTVESQIACWESKIGISYFFYSFGVESRPAAYIMVSTC